ncbi:MULTISPECIES: ParA family protein [unclassified Calothrix]|uniref:ParA family protein n=1 Tax=unclassified Calothrix TaxID=2619626 RepID=UPI002410E5E6|nr:MULTISPECIES: ParA family protein [unclassified Calothrix]
MSEDIWEKEFESKKLTLPYLFKDPEYFLENIKNENFIVKQNISNVRNRNSFAHLHLIPSSPRLFEIQEQLPSGYYSFNFKPVELIRTILKPLLNNYDYILIDCAPNINTVVKSAFLASSACIIPCVPNRMSIHGLDLLLEHIEKFNRDYVHNLKPLGTLISRYNRTIAQSENLNSIIVNPFYLPVFETKILERAKIAEGLELSNYLTYKQKYDDSHESMVKLAKEVIQRVGK